MPYSCRLQSCRHPRSEAVDNLLAPAPLPTLLCAVGVGDHADAVLPSADPLAGVGPAAGPCVDTLSSLHVMPEAALVARPAGHEHRALALHAAVPPLAAVHPAVSEGVAALPVHLVTLELT